MKRLLVRLQALELEGTIAPNGSEFSHRVWISIFLFFLFALSLQKFTGSHCIVPMHVYLNLLTNTRSRSSTRKTTAGVISQWFWCKYRAHNFILYSKSSKKNLQATYTALKNRHVLIFFYRSGERTLRREEHILPHLSHLSQLDSFSAQRQRRLVCWTKWNHVLLKLKYVKILGMR